MSNERDAAVERVLNDLRVLLTRRVETGCPCGRAERYTVPQGEVLAEAKTVGCAEIEIRRRQLGRARLHLEIASEQLDRAFDHVDTLGDRMGF